MRHSLVAITFIFVFGWGLASRSTAKDGSAGRPQTAGERTEHAKVVILHLDSRPTRAHGDMDGALLLRELFRQALLIAGREELGLVTRDATLRESIPKSSSVDLVANVNPRKSIGLEVRRHRKDQDESLWKKTIKGNFLAGEQVDYLKVLELAEGFSRDEFVQALTRFGWVKIPKQPPSEPDAETVDGKSNPPALCFLDQFAELRRLHASGRSQGQSPERLARLALGYANLGQLTLYHWSTADKAFAARALLYAQRLHVQDKQAPLGHWVRAYAEAMAGLDALALLDLATAEKLYDAMKQDDRPRRPAWVDLLESYCRYHTSELQDAGRIPGPYQQLACLLAVRTLEGTAAKLATLDAVEQALLVNPQCYRVIDAMCRVGGVGNLHHATLLGPRTLATGLPEKLLAIEDLPPSVAKLLKSGGFDDAVGQRARRLFGLAGAAIGPTSWKFAQGLVDASDADLGELSWSVLGRLIQETIFMHAHRRGYFMRYTWSVPMEDFVSEVLPTLSDHPYRVFIESYEFNHLRERDKFQAVLKDLDIRDPQVKMAPMIYATIKVNTPGRMQGVEAWRLAILHADSTSADLVEVTAVSRANKKAPYARMLFEISPHSAVAMATLISLDWNFASDHADQWEKEHGDHPAVLAALAWRHHTLKRYEQAEPLLRRYVDRSPDRWAYDALAEGFLKRDDEAMWLDTLEECLTKPDHALDHANVRVKIARHYMADERWEDAQPYAVAAAQTGAGWAMKCAAECEEGLENWQEAERWVRSNSERYVGSRTDWYLWCKRTGYGNLPQAKRLADAWMESVRRSNSIGDVRLMGIMHILDGRKDEAMDAFRDAYDKKSVAYDGVHVALLATELEAEKARSEILKKIVEKRPGTGAQTEHRFAKLLHDHFDDEAEFDLAIVDDMIAASNKGERANLEYFVGRFLELAGRKDEGLKYLKRCASQEDKTRWNVALANDLLRSRDIDLNDDD